LQRHRSRRDRDRGVQDGTARHERADDQAHRAAPAGGARRHRQCHHVPVLAGRRLHHRRGPAGDGRHGPLHLLMVKLLEVSTDHFVTTIRLNRPPVNALVPELQEELLETLNQLKDHDPTRVVVLTSAIDRYFMAGADIKAMGGDGGFDRENPATLERVAQMSRRIKAALPAEGFHEAALERARRLAQAAPLALRLAKEALLAGLERAPGKGYEVEAENFGRAAMTEDAMTGIMSFVSKQPPDFKGK